ncbi:MAG: SIS domain-containing protein [Planctomycetes bacterium]|nr:SIS domain-containing protein [Planctomycetota bacterium]
MNSGDSIRRTLDEAAAVQAAFRADATAMAACEAFADAALATLRRGGTIFSCGNGGSMSDAMHFAEEWSGRFRKDRAALPAMAFSDPAAMSCIANDFGFDHVFARQVEAQGKAVDLLDALSTSGNSPNILLACEAARQRGLTVVGLLGRGGGKMKDACDIAVVVPLGTTSDRIQEVHIQVIHAVIEAAERSLFPGNYA